MPGITFMTMVSHVHDSTAGCILMPGITFTTMVLFGCFEE